MEAVHETTIASAIGRIRFSFAADGSLVEVKLRAFNPEGERALLDGAPVEGGRRPAGAPGIRALKSWLKAKMSGTEADFPGAWRVPGSTPFATKVYEVVAQIPAGQTLSYAEVAEQAGSPKASRAVGNTMARNPIPLVVPCHRVLGANGLGGFTGGLDLKENLLACEAR